MTCGICDSKMAASLSFGTLMNFGDKTSNNSDSWQDANTALAELDKGALLEFICLIVVMIYSLGRSVGIRKSAR